MRVWYWLLPASLVFYTGSSFFVFVSEGGGQTRGRRKGRGVEERSREKKRMLQQRKPTLYLFWGEALTRRRKKGRKRNKQKKKERRVQGRRKKERKKKSFARPHLATRARPRVDSPRPRTSGSTQHYINCLSRLPSSWSWASSLFLLLVPPLQYTYHLSQSVNQS